MMYDVTLVSCILINQLVKKPRKFAKPASKYARLTDAVREGDRAPTSFPGFLILPPPRSPHGAAPGDSKMRDPGNEDPRAPPVNCLFGEERAPGSKVRWKIEPVIASKTAIALYKNLI